MYDLAGKIVFRVPGMDIKARFEERAAAAEKAAAEADPKDRCQEGIKEIATHDAARFRLMAKYVDPDDTYELMREGLAEVFLAEPVYQRQLDRGPSSTAPMAY